MGLGGRALQPLGRLTKSTHAGSWSYRSSPPSRLVSRHHDDADPGFGLVAPKCQLYRRLYMRIYMRTDLCKMGAKLHVNPAATQCGRKTAYCTPAARRTPSARRA